MCACNHCGGSLQESVRIRTQFIRICLHCGKPNTWDLDEGQKPVGYNIDADAKKEEDVV